VLEMFSALRRFDDAKKWADEYARSGRGAAGEAGLQSDSRRPQGAHSDALHCHHPTPPHLPPPTTPHPCHPSTPPLNP